MHLQFFVALQLPREYTIFIYLNHSCTRKYCWTSSKQRSKYWHLHHHAISISMIVMRYHSNGVDYHVVRLVRYPCGIAIEITLFCDWNKKQAQHSRLLCKFRDWEKNPSFLIPVSGSQLFFGRAARARHIVTKNVAKRNDSVFTIANQPQIL